MTAAEPRLHVLYDTSSAAPVTAAEERYGAPLRFPSGAEPYIFTNFVSTLDGVVSLGLRDGTDSGAVSGYAAADRYIMAMLRAAADAVVIGAGTLADSIGHQWTPAQLVPDVAAGLAAYRASLGRPQPSATLAIVTGSGRLPQHVALSQPAAPVVVITTRRGAAAAERSGHPVVVAGDAGVDAGALTTVLRERGWRLVLCEGGPRLMGTLAAGDAIAELFLTVSPRIAGRDAEHPRPGMVEGYAADPRSLQDYELLSARRAEAHLFLRYRRRRGDA